jgi:hypothetical protein
MHVVLTDGKDYVKNKWSQIFRYLISSPCHWMYCGRKMFMKRKTITVKFLWKSQRQILSSLQP